MRQLFRMCDARQLAAWDHTAAICATVINMHRDPKKSRPVDSADLNPYRKEAAAGGKPRIRLDKSDSMKLLKRVFADHRPPNLAARECGQTE